MSTIYFHLGIDNNTKINIIQNMEEQKELELWEITHAIIAIDKGSMDRIQAIPHEDLDVKDFHFEILHFCGYWAEPSMTDYLSLYNEVRRDEEFGVEEEFFLIPAPNDLIEQKINEMGYEWKPRSEK